MVARRNARCDAFACGRVSQVSESKESGEPSAARMAGRLRKCSAPERQNPERGKKREASAMQMRGPKEPMLQSQDGWM